MNWIVEDFHAENAYKGLVTAIRAQGHNLKLFTLRDNFEGHTQPFPTGECVLFQGSLSAAQNLLAKKWWTPTAWLNAPAYECSAYYPKLAQFLFNDTHKFLTKGEFDANIDVIWEEFGRDDHVFLRPSNGLKSFDGTLFTKEKYTGAKWLDNFTTPDTLVVVSTPKTILKEWRCIVDGAQVVASSQYKSNGQRETQRGCPPEVQAFAQKVLQAGYQPDPMWCLDVCADADGTPWLLEIGSFSCAGIYACDPEAIVQRASQLALEAHLHPVSDIAL